MFYNSKQRAYMWKESVVYKKKTGHQHQSITQTKNKLT